MWYFRWVRVGWRRCKFVYDQQHVTSHLQYVISPYAIEISAVHSTRCTIWRAIDCTYLITYTYDLRPWPMRVLGFFPFTPNYIFLVVSPYIGKAKVWHFSRRCVIMPLIRLTPIKTIILLQKLVGDTSIKLSTTFTLWKRLFHSFFINGCLIPKKNRISKSKSI
jgi:hypothetical protein